MANYFNELPKKKVAFYSEYKQMSTLHGEQRQHSILLLYHELLYLINEDSQD